MIMIIIITIIMERCGMAVRGQAETRIKLGVAGAGGLLLFLALVRIMLMVLLMTMMTMMVMMVDFSSSLPLGRIMLMVIGTNEQPWYL